MLVPAPGAQMIAPLAHTGHWLINVLYILPLVVVLAVLGRQQLKDRRRARSDDSAAPPGQRSD